MKRADQARHLLLEAQTLLLAEASDIHRRLAGVGAALAGFEDAAGLASAPPPREADANSHVPEPPPRRSRKLKTDGLLDRAISLFGETGHPMKSADVAKALGHDARKMGSILGGGYLRGRLSRPEPGTYFLAESPAGQDTEVPLKKQ